MRLNEFDTCSIALGGSVKSISSLPKSMQELSPNSFLI